MNPPSIVNNSDEANFTLYISWRERMIINSRREYNMELPVPAMDFRLHKKKKDYNQIKLLLKQHHDEDKKSYQSFPNKNQDPWTTTSRIKGDNTSTQLI